MMMSVKEIYEHCKAANQTPCARLVGAFIFSID